MRSRFRISFFLLFLSASAFSAFDSSAADLSSETLAKGERPNILFCISDDQSYAHTGANGDPVVSTPDFDRIADEGIRFTHAFCDAPTCGPSRSAILTGQPIWRLEKSKDPRVGGGKVDWDFYPYYGKISTTGWTVDLKP